MTRSERSDIRELLTRGNDRPVYMVLRHAGVEPRAAVDALYAAGLTPKTYGIECRELTSRQVDVIVADFVKRGEQ